MPRVVHLFRPDVEEDDRALPSAGDGSCRGLVEGEVNVRSRATEQAVAADRIEEAIHGAVKERRRWLARGETEVYRDGMALVRADVEAVGREREPLLVARRDDFFESLFVELDAVGAKACEHAFDVGPAGVVERECEGRRLVPEREAEELRDLDPVHR